MKNTVVGKSYNNIRDEITAGGAITPGNLIVRNSAGAVIRHNVASGPSEKLFAIEDSYQGKGLNDDYASGQPVIAWTAGRGDRVRAIAGAAVAVGDLVASDGAGKLVPFAITSASVPMDGAIVGQALEAAAADGNRILVQVF